MSEDDLSSGQSEDEDILAHQKGKGTDASSDAATMPLQKRRRVTRACDECRRKKIKCDGKQPCTHCQVYSYECTYDKPSNRRRNPAPQYIEALENRLQRAEALLRKFMPDVDLSDPNLDPSVQQEFRLREQARSKALRKDEAPTPSSSKSDERLMSMISGVGQLDFDDKGDYDFHGPSSGAVFFRRMKDHFRTLLGRDYHIPVLPRPPRHSAVWTVDSPRQAAAALPGNRKAIGPELSPLPTKTEARQLCGYSFKYATCLLRIVHIPTFYTMLDNIYDRPNGGSGKDEDRDLALLYSVMALGCMYNVKESKDTKRLPYEVATERGLKYYTSARTLQHDLTDCRDLTSLQALLFMILFIQSISNLSTCYGFVGIAMRSALRMGLHRNLPHAQDSAIDVETRRRVFSVCRQLDIYVSAILGFPMLLSDEDIDQPLPSLIDDSFITKDGLLPTPPEVTPIFEAFNAHARLMDILSKIIKHVYPLKGIEQTVAEGGQVNPSYMISYVKVKELETALQQWNEGLPNTWRPDSEGPEEVIRVRNLLRFAYAHVQMVLYRPFVHAVSPQMTAGKKVDDRSYAFGAAGINVARNIIHIGIEMRKQVSLVGPYWFTLFTEFFAILTLVYYVLENEDKAGTDEIMADAIAGRDMIKKLAWSSVAADRISNALEALFDQLQDRLKIMGGTGSVSKKRSATTGTGKGKRTRSPHVPQGHGPHSVQHVNRGQIKTTVSDSSSVGITSSIPFEIETAFNFEDLSPSVQGLSPLNLTAGRHGSDHTSQADSVHHHMHQDPNQGLNHIHQLDAMMFPSENPMAYPSQPEINLGEHHDQAQFYMPPNLFDGIEGQLMAPLPSYLMQTQGQPGFPFQPQMYADPVLSFQLQNNPGRIPQHAGQHPQAGQQQQQQHQHQHQHQQHQNQQRRRVLNQFSNPSWSNVFPHYE
ncbi:fungal-specific transcription factor domain-containing protein [Xylariales sp. PMI_506]|nr:fungal-specific transcription factor domain-containing protein [Xylariales sp. PMI_506]